MDSSFLKISEGIDVQPLLNKLKSFPLLWGEITARQKTPGSAHAHTRAIFLRWAKELSIHATFNDLKAMNYPALKVLEDEAIPLIDKIFLEVEGIELGRVLIVDPKPFGVIQAHADEGAYADKYERFHLSMASDEGNEFFVQTTPEVGEFVHMKAGQLWWFDHKKTHWLINDSEHMRTHLIVDVVAPKYRRERQAWVTQ